MPRFANMLTAGMAQRGHTIEVWTPEAHFYKLPVPGALKKWMGYIDQYILFSRAVKHKLKKLNQDNGNTLFVFTDHALGPWVPLIKNKPHVIHCHDFLAQRSALGEIPENPTSKSGQQYQAYIRRGYQKGKNFISVSQKTREDLHRFLPVLPQISEVVYNGMNQDIKKQDVRKARAKLSKEIKIDVSQGYLLHVGGNQWYKNRIGVIEIYERWRATNTRHLPLLMIGAQPSEALKQKKNEATYKQDIHFCCGLNDEYVQYAYAGAIVFLYPSIAEGFGWPIAEAMAAGCPVVTTGEAPMNEVGGDAAVYIPKRPSPASNADWTINCAKIIDNVANFNAEQTQAIIKAGFDNVQRFNTETALNKIEAIYKSILGTL